MKHPTLHDVARLAGVSYATADRVVNRRGNVAEKSVRKIEGAVAQLGYVRNLAAANLSRNHIYRFCFILPRSSNRFFEKMHDQLDKAQAHLRPASVVTEVIEIDAFDVASLKQAIESIKNSQYDGVAIVGLNNEALKEPLQVLQNKNIHIISLVSDLPKESRDFYIGINNQKAGRSAARLVGLAHRGSTGRIVVLAGSMDALDHYDRLDGFRTVLEQDFKNISLSQVLETNDDPFKARTLLQDFLDKDPNITGVYNVGAGNEGVVDALRNHKRSNLIISCTHELDHITRSALQEGVIDITIDQNPAIELNRTLYLLQALANNLPPPPVPELVPAIHVRDNLPD